MSSIVFTHPRICQFYANHPSIDSETAHLHFIDLLEQIYETRDPSVDPNHLSPSFQQNELSKTLGGLKDTVSIFHKYVLSQWIVAKTNYIHEFKSVMECGDGNVSMDTLLQNNKTLVDTIVAITSDIVNIRSSISNDKIGSSIKQFQKIIHANVESIASKIHSTADISQLTQIFITNFEINAAHMIQTIQQWLGEFISLKEKAVETVLAVSAKDPSSGSNDYYRTLYDLHDSLHHFKQKGYGSRESDSVEYGEFDTLVAKYYSTASVLRESDQSILLSRESKTPIYIEHHAVKDRNIRADEIKLFLRSTQEKQCHGILASQWTGITAKPHLYIEIQNHRVMVYVHQLGHSTEKLQMAVDIIETLSAKLEEYYAAGENKQLIPKDVLDEINREYQYFICQKENILGYIKESHKKIIAQLDEMKFVSLDKFLSTRYSSCKKQGFVCDLCHTFTVHTLKGLAAHKRGCQRKINNSESVKPNSSLLVKPTVPETPVENELCEMSLISTH
jgi:hypothetical protein